MLLSHCIFPGRDLCRGDFSAEKVDKTGLCGYNHRVKSRNGTKSEVNVHGYFAEVQDETGYAVRGHIGAGCGRPWTWS